MLEILQKIESLVGYKFKNQELLKTAFVHTSYAYENKVQSNEKLEFLGDAILEFVVSSYLYNNYSKLKEGEMTKVRAQVVCEESLHKVAIKHNFSDFLFMGKSELIVEGNKRPAVLADSVEAFIAALYIDSNDINIPKKFILDNLKDSIEEATLNVGKKDYKTVLQEKLQVHGDVKIEYITIKEEGPDHNKTFTVELYCNNKKLSVGQGSSKKHAEIEAARIALSKLE